MPREGSNKPRSAREWKVFRAGVLEGVELAHRNAHEQAERFLLRVQLGSVELSTPSATEAERSRVATPPGAVPPVKRGRTG